MQKLSEYRVRDDIKIRVSTPRGKEIGANYIKLKVLLFAVIFCQLCINYFFYYGTHCTHYKNAVAPNVSSIFIYLENELSHMYVERVTQYTKVNKVHAWAVFACARSLKTKFGWFASQVLPSQITLFTIENSFWISYNFIYYSTHTSIRMLSDKIRRKVGCYAHNAQATREPAVFSDDIHFMSGAVLRWTQQIVFS